MLTRARAPIASDIANQYARSGRESQQYGLRDGYIPWYFVLVVDDSSTGNFENAINEFKDNVINDELAETVIVYDVEEQQNGECGDEHWLNELKLMLDHVD